MAPHDGLLRLCASAPLVLGLHAALLGCAASEPDGPLQRETRHGKIGVGEASLELRVGSSAPLAVRSPADDQGMHIGPSVHISDDGPARFVEAFFAAFVVERAMDDVRAIDGWYRAAANEGFEATLDRLEAALREAGFGGEDERLELQILESDPVPAWTPRRGQVSLLLEGQEPVVLHSFSEPGDVDRVILPENAPSCDVQGPLATSLAELDPGEVLVTEVPAAQVLERARDAGAAGVVSGSLEDFNVDPSGEQRHLDAIQYTQVKPGAEMPAFQVSTRSLERLREAAETEGARVALRAAVTVEERPLRTLIATIVGAEQPGEAVVLASHVQEPGACDNATGVAGMLEGARNLSGLLATERIAWPARSVAFVWGDEFLQSRVWLDRSGRTAVAGLSSDMTGESPERTGSIALLERMPDPGAISTLPPDRHSAWGAGHVDASDLRPNGLAVVARCAMIDVGLLIGGTWRTADHPWEGGSDHEVFIERGVPAVLFWHFTDFTYHTSLDRMEMVDGAELRRTTTALLATALAIADPRASDLDRYVRSLDIERRVRVDAALEAKDGELADRWRDWCKGARGWLEDHCVPGSAGAGD